MFLTLHGPSHSLVCWMRFVALQHPTCWCLLPAFHSKVCGSLLETEWTEPTGLHDNVTFVFGKLREIWFWSNYLLRKHYGVKRSNKCTHAATKKKVEWGREREGDGRGGGREAGTGGQRGWLRIFSPPNYAHKPSEVVANGEVLNKVRLIQSLCR